MATIKIQDMLNRAYDSKASKRLEEQKEYTFALNHHLSSNRCSSDRDSLRRAEHYALHLLNTDRRY